MKRLLTLFLVICAGAVFAQPTIWGGAKLSVTQGDTTYNITVGGVRTWVAANLQAISLIQPTPASVGSGSGTAAGNVETITGAAGGATSANSGSVTGGVGGGIVATGGTGGAITGSPGTGTGGAGGQITFTAGTGGAGTTFGGTGGNANFQAGDGGNGTTPGSGGYAALKGGNGSVSGNSSGGNVFLVGGAKTGSGSVGNIYLGVSPSFTSRGKVKVGGSTPPSALMTLGEAGSTLGSLSMAGNTSGTITIQPAAAAGTYTLTMPTDDGTGVQVLQTDGSGVLSWGTPAAGTVTAVSVASANGFAGSSSGGATPALTLTTTITGILKGNGTTISSATAGTDYSAGTSALATGILKTTTSTGALTIAVAGDFPTLNQSTTGSAATLTTPRNIYGNAFDGSAALTQIIASTFGGTGNGFTKFSGPASTEKTFTLPNASASILTDNAAVTVSQGGTGVTSASITAFNNITGFSAAGTTGTTSTNLVFSTSPTLVTPILGTPTSVTLTNATGLPVSTGISGLGAGVATFLATPSSANLLAAVTDESGTGALIFGTTPTLATPVINGLATGTGVSAGATASVLAARDANANLTSNNHIAGYTTTATAAGTTTLTVGSTRQQFFTGTTTQTVTLPVTSTLVLGQQFEIVNNSTGVVTVNSSGGNAVVAMVAASKAMLTCILTSGTSAASWSIEYDGITTVTGTGSMVLSKSPTLVTPALGTPSSATLTNATGLPISTGVSGLGTGVATFLGTPSSANLAAAVTDETGSGAAVFATSPTFVTPILGTPTSATLTNATGLPLTTGVTGILPGANGGTNNGFMDFTGPASTLKTFTLPNASATILTTNAVVTIAQGGTGTGSTLTGLLLGNASAFTAITSSTTGQVPRVTGANTFAFGALDLANANAVTGVLPFANGGMDIVSGRATAQTAANNSVATLTVGGADASYTVSGDILVTTSSGESFSLVVDYTDEGNTARSATIPIVRIATGGFTATTISASGAVPYPSTMLQIRCKASTAITVKTSGTFTGCTYNVEARIIRI